MSQLRFDVSVVNSGSSSSSKARAAAIPVPPDDPLINEAFSPTFNSRSADGSPGKPRTSRAARSSQPTLGVTQLASSPLSAGKVLLKNAEKFPVMYRIHILRTSATRRRRSATTTTTTGTTTALGSKIKPVRGDDDGESEGDAEEETMEEQLRYDGGADDAALYVHPVRGTIKPGKTRAVAALLPPPQRNDDDSSKAASSSIKMKQQQQRSNSPFGSRKVTFAGDSGDDGGFLGSPSSPSTGSNNNAKVLVRMQIEARVLLTGDLPEAVLEIKRQRDAEQAASEVHNEDNDDEDDDEDEKEEEQSLFNKKNLHRDELELLHLNDEKWQSRWSTALELPTRTIEIVSVTPEVTREQWLEYLVEKKLLPRCDRLAKMNAALVNKHETSLRQIADFKAADREDKLKFLKRQSVVRVPVWMFVAMVLAMFLVGLGA